MKLSIIIVNYNVKHFLKQCLGSIAQAANSIVHEIICIDNNSVDGSVKMLVKEFPQVKLLKNKNNLGFAKACNQGIEISKGEYILILNPDTVLEHDSLSKPIRFMDANQQAGSLGVKMIDGNGKFLPESKRGLPTPSAAFYKMSGLSKLFYPSKVFGKYYLDYLDKDQVQKVHVLTGAFMLIRKTVLDKVGIFDEQFFMYGEDVDLSHRIINAGYDNIYFPETRIIHYKGESTKKESVKYVHSFYKAMLIFSEKHFSKKNNKIFSFLINTAIVFRAFLALILRFLKEIILPLIDFVVMAIGIVAITQLWETFVTYTDGGSYPIFFYQIIIPIYTLVYVTIIYLSGGYDKPYRHHKMIWAIIIGTIIILVSYSLLDESLRFSRSIILLGSLWALISLIGLRWLLAQIGIRQFRKKELKRIIIVGKPDEVHRITALIFKNKDQIDFLAFVSPNEETIIFEKYIGSINSLKELVQFYNITELIFSSKDISFQLIFDKLTELESSSISSKIAPENSLSIIGSKSIMNTEDLFLQEIFTFSNKTNIRIKRMFDLLISVLFLLTLPFGLFIVPNGSGFIKNIFWVIANKKSWVGFHPQKNETFKLPSKKSSVLFISDGIKNFQEEANLIQTINMSYTQKYQILKDLQIIFTGRANLGRW